jgi:hypothetical protein
MRIWLPGWALLLYLAIDLANPFVPGAFRFTPEEGLVWVEGTSLGREGSGSGVPAARVRAQAAHVPASSRELRAPMGPVRAWRLTTWLARVRTGDPPARDLPPPSSDDH